MNADNTEIVMQQVAFAETVGFQTPPAMEKQKT